MKAERSRLHKLYITNPDRNCPPREEPRVWDMLKTYWKSPEFEKVSKVSFFSCHNAQTTFNMYVYAEESAHAGRICMVMDMRISVFIVGGGGNG
jgi:hypothetical protein